MEYLFLGEHPVLPGEMDRVIELGLRPGSELATLVRSGMQEPFEIWKALLLTLGHTNSAQPDFILFHQVSLYCVPAVGSTNRPNLFPAHMQGLDGGVMMSNSLYLADMLRLHAVVDSRSMASSQGGAVQV